MKLFKFAEKMQLAPTEGERAMWHLLKADVLLDFKFRRQHPIATFIADFYCHELRLVIEIDGGYHLSGFQKEYDDFRNEDMMTIGITVIRFTNHEVIKENKFVLQKLSDKIKLLQNINSSTNLV